MTLQKILNFKTRRPERLRDVPFTKSYCMYNDINDLVSRYAQEIGESFRDYQRGELSAAALRLLLSRAMYASYKRGLTDGKAGARAERVTMFRQENTGRGASRHCANIGTKSKADPVENLPQGKTRAR